jgi:hypothetical protein
LQDHSKDAAIKQLMRKRLGGAASWISDWPSHNHVGL